MSDADNQDQQQRLKSAVWYTVGRIAEAEGIVVLPHSESLGSENTGKTASPQFIASLADVVYKQMETLAMDVEMFARHAKRSTVSMDDVKVGVVLCARRNDGLYALISEEAKEIAKKPTKSRR
ncbi:Centromere protein S [Umbelopsis nana]